MHPLLAVCFLLLRGWCVRTDGYLLFVVPCEQKGTKKTKLLVKLLVMVGSVSVVFTFACVDGLFLSKHALGYFSPCLFPPLLPSSLSFILFALPLLF